MLGRVSIRFLVPVLMGLPVAVAAFWLVLLWSGHAQRTTRMLGSAEVEQIHGRISERLNALLTMPARATKIHRGQIRSDRLDPSDLRSWRQPFFEFVDAMDMFSGMTWGAADGDVVWVFRYPGKPRPELGISDSQTFRDGVRFVEEYALGQHGEILELVGDYAYDPRERPWYTGALAAGQATFLDPYAWVNVDGQATTLGVPFVEPMYDDAGDIQGVLTAEFSLARLAAFLRSLRVGQTGYVLILDAEGRLLAHSLPPDEVPVSIERDGVPSVAIAGEVQDPRVRLAAAEVERSLGNALIGSGEANIEGETVLLRVSAYRGVPGLDWRIITAIPEAELLAPVAAARASSDRATAWAVGLTILLGLALGIVATRPISRLVGEIRQVGQGELDERVGAAPSRELREIAEAVNTMAKDLQDRVRMRESLMVAMEVQKNLLPQEPPSVRGLDIAGHSTYCDETGGDYYDYLDIQGLGEQSVALAIGDVMGHGVAAAMLMATARGILRSRSDEPASLGELLTHMNNLLVADTGGQRFMTMLLVLLDSSDCTMTWSSAGHDPPFVYRSGSDRFEELDGGGIPLGLFEGQNYSTERAGPWDRGDILVLSTDGLWEARLASEGFYGKERLEAVIREAARGSAEQIADAIRADHRAACVGRAQDDDITFMVAKFV